MEHPFTINDFLFVIVIILFLTVIAALVSMFFYWRKEAKQIQLEESSEKIKQRFDGMFTTNFNVTQYKN